MSENIRIRLICLEAEEYKYLDGWDKTKHKGATRVERIPTALLDDVCINSIREYRNFFPDALFGEFCALDFSKTIKRTPRYSYPILRLFLELGVIEHIRTDGRKFIYKKTEKSIDEA